MHREPRSQTSDLVGFHHVNLSVRNCEASATWYADLLGLARVKEMEDDGRRGAKIILMHWPSRMLLGFTSHQANAGEPFNEVRTGLDHLAFALADPQALDRWRERLEAHGVSYSVSSTSPLITFRDLDNIQLQLYVRQYPTPRGLPDQTS
ncbi:MAG: VOC family protein [Candidatus Dormibacteria bacterium]